MELTSLLNATDSLAEQNNFVTGYSFDSNNDTGIIGNRSIKDASISNAKIGTAVIGTANIGTLSFNEILGGTGVFGGTNNGNGVISVLNQQGTQVVRLDGSGMLVSGGSITIKNSSGSNVIDATGLVSTNNFISGNTNAAPDTAFTNGTFVTTANSSMTFSLSRSAKALILLTLQSSQGQGTDGANASGRVFFTIHYNGTAQNPDIVIDPSLVDETAERDHIQRCTYTTTMLKTLGSGAGTIDFRYKIDTGSNLSVTLHKWDLTYVLLGI